MSRVVPTARTCSFWLFPSAVMVEALDVLAVGERLAVLPLILLSAEEFLQLALNQEPLEENIMARTLALEAIQEILGSKGVLDPQKATRALEVSHQLFEFLRAGGQLTDAQISTKHVLSHIFKCLQRCGEAEISARAQDDLSF